MKQWNATQSSSAIDKKDINVSDLYKNEILETRIAVSKILSDFRLKSVSKLLQNKTDKLKPTKQEN